MARKKIYAGNLVIKTIAVREPMVDKIMKLAKDSGLSFNRTVNILLERAMENNDDYVILKAENERLRDENDRLLSLLKEITQTTIDDKKTDEVIKKVVEKFRDKFDWMMKDVESYVRNKRTIRRLIADAVEYEFLKIGARFDKRQINKKIDEILTQVINDGAARENPNQTA